MKRRLLILFVVLCLLYVCYRIVLHWMVEAKLSEIRRQGYPVTMAELEAWRETPAASANGALFVTNALAKIVPANRMDKMLPILGVAQIPNPGEDWPPEFLRVSKEHLLKNEEALELFHRVGEYTRYAYPWTYATNLLQVPMMPYFPALREATRLLCLEAEIGAQSTNSKSAARSLSAAVQFGDSLAREPLLLPQLVRFACLGMGIDHLSRALTRVEFEDEQLLELSAALAPIEQAQSLERAFVGELCYGTTAFREQATRKIILDEASNWWVGLMTDDEPYAKWMMGWRLWVYRSAGLLKLDQLEHLHQLRQAIECAKQPLPTRLVAIERWLQGTKAISRFRVMTRQFVGSLDSVVRHEAQMVARVRSARAAIAIEQYRHERQKLPVELPGDFFDPIDGKKLRYRQLLRGYVVYSIGTDGVNDGGDKKKDNTFTVER